VKLTYMYSFVGIVLAAFASLGIESTVCSFVGPCFTYINQSMEQAALTLVAVLFLVKGFVGLLDSAIIPDEAHQGNNFFMDTDPKKRDQYYLSNDYYLYLKKFDVDAF